MSEKPADLVTQRDLDAAIAKLRQEFSEADEDLLREVNESAESAAEAAADAQSIATAIQESLEATRGEVRSEIDDLRHTLFLDHELAHLTLPITLIEHMETCATELSGKGFHKAAASAATFVKAGDVPAIRRTPRTDFPSDYTAAGTLALTLRNAIALHQAARSLPPSARPIVEYYSANQLVHFLTDLAFNYPKAPTHHGLSFDADEAAFNGVLTISKQGMFPRFSAALALLGQPNVFRDFLYVDHPATGLGLVQLVDCAYLPGKDLTLEQLLGLECSTLFPEEVHGTRFDEETRRRFVTTSEVLADYACMFVASDISRYHPAMWKELLEGHSTGAAVRFGQASRRLTRLFRTTLSWVEDWTDGNAPRPATLSTV